MKKRSETREILLKVLYEMEMKEDFSKENRDEILEDYDLDGVDKQYLYFILSKILEDFKTLDKLIKNNIKNKSLSRISKIDLQILRIACLEMLYIKEIPFKVSMDEAVKLSKKYSTENSYKFVNAVLGTIVKNYDFKMRDEYEKL